MVINFKGRPLSWMFWHPHQKLWNWNLVTAIQKLSPITPVNKVLIKILIFLDTIFLFIRAVGRRISVLGVAQLFSSARIAEQQQLIYFDMGTHKEGAELKLMADDILPNITDNFIAYGFEASQQSYNEVCKVFADDNKVNVIHKALCSTPPANGKIRLYHSGKGLGDSLYRVSESGSFEEVDAVRFSDWLNENGISLKNMICIIRMNIEGAEYDVLQDLIESGNSHYVDGFYGMWDDLSKISKQRDDDFRLFLAENHIHPFTFNGRDLISSWRKKCIEYDLYTHIKAGANNISKL
jgi:FkbM family methyltransferase